jgi:hypothetical protein
VNAPGELVAKLRHHFYWRDVWDDIAWKLELQSFVSAFDALLQTTSTADGIHLEDRETRSQSILDSLAPVAGSPSLLTVTEEIRALISDGNCGRAHQVIERWRTSGVLRPEDGLELDRLGIFALLAEHKAGDAMAEAARVLLKPERTADDIALAARCALDSKDFKRAAQLMHEALDESLPVATAKTLALKIAGAAGDKRLTERVMK